MMMMKTCRRVIDDGAWWNVVWSVDNDGESTMTMNTLFLECCRVGRHDFGSQEVVESYNVV